MVKETQADIALRITNVKSLPLRKGKNELLAHLEGGREITKSDALTAKCYDCMGGYDEAEDCRVTACPLHPWMPYREGGVRKSRSMSDEQRQAAAERLRQVRGAATASESTAEGAWNESA